MNVKELKGKLDAVPDDYEVALEDKNCNLDSMKKIIINEGEKIVVLTYEEDF